MRKSYCDFCKEESSGDCICIKHPGKETHFQDICQECLKKVEDILYYGNLTPEDLEPATPTTEAKPRGK